MSDDVESGEVILNIPKNKAIASKETWLRIQTDYEAGNYKTLAELSSRYGISDSALEKRVSRGKWYEKQSALRQRVSEKVIEVAETEVQAYLKRTFKRTEKWEKIIDASISQQPTTADGTPLVETDQIDQLTKAELRIHELGKSSLRIVDSKHIEHTGGIAVFNVTEAIKALRAQPVPDLTSEELDRLKDCWIEGEEPVG